MKKFVLLSVVSMLFAGLSFAGDEPQLHWNFEISCVRKGTDKDGALASPCSFQIYGGSNGTGLLVQRYCVKKDGTVTGLKFVKHVTLSQANDDTVSVCITEEKRLDGKCPLLMTYNVSETKVEAMSWKASTATFTCTNAQ